MVRNSNSALMFGLAIAAVLHTGLGTSQCFADELTKGKEIYNGKGACSGCHGMEGKGDGAAAAALNPKPRDLSIGDFALDTDGDGKKGTEADIANVVQFGAQKYGGSMFMAARPDLSAEERTALAKYVLSLKK